MHNRKLITLLAGTAAFAATPLALAQSTDPSTGMNTTSGSTTTGDRTMGTPDSPTTTGSSGQSATDQSTTGQTTTGQTTTGTTGTSTTGTTGTSTDMTAGSTGSTSGTASLQGTDATFLRKALEGGREEVQKAEAAMRNAQRAEVRNVASTMHEEHRRSNEKLEQLASRKGWNVPAAPDTAATDTAESDQQRRMGEGAAFDDNYLEEEIRHHRETIALYRAQASSGSDPELRQFAQDSLPTLEHHLEMLQGSLSAK